MKYILTLGGILFCLFSLPVLALAGRLLLSNVQILASWVLTTGTITEIRQIRVEDLLSGEFAAMDYCPIAEIVTAKGQTISTYLLDIECSSPAHQYNVGDSIEIYYDPYDVQEPYSTQSRTATHTNIRTAIYMAIIGGTAAIIGIAAITGNLYINRRKVRGLV
jgi:hypothetical protein